MRVLVVAQMTSARVLERNAVKSSAGSRGARAGGFRGQSPWDRFPGRLAVLSASPERCGASTGTGGSRTPRAAPQAAQRRAVTPQTEIGRVKHRPPIYKRPATRRQEASRACRSVSVEDSG